MPVYFEAQGNRGTAVWRASDDATDVYLCGVDLQAYEDAQVRAHFASLVEVVAAYHRRTHVAGTADPGAWIAELPCIKCDSPLAADVLHRARQSASLIELGLSPGGNYPAGCCKTRVVGVIGRGSDSPRPVARR
jgi:hypothetical protein